MISKKTLFLQKEWGQLEGIVEVFKSIYEVEYDSKIKADVAIVHDSCPLQFNNTTVLAVKDKDEIENIKDIFTALNRYQHYMCTDDFSALFCVGINDPIQYLVKLKSKLITSKSKNNKLRELQYQILEPFTALYILMQGYLIIKTDKEYMKLQNSDIDLKKINIQNGAKEKVCTMSWWKECIGIKDNKDDDSPYCLAHKSCERFVYCDDYEKKINEFETAASLKDSVVVKKILSIEKEKWSCLRFICEFIIANNQEIIEKQPGMNEIAAKWDGFYRENKTKLTDDWNNRDFLPAIKELSLSMVIANAVEEYENILQSTNIT